MSLSQRCWSNYYTLCFIEIQKTASSGTVVEPWVIDLTDFKTVSDFADRYEKEGNGQLDVLVMNAGINVAGKYSKDESGWEKSYVQVLSSSSP